MERKRCMTELKAGYQACLDVGCSINYFFQGRNCILCGIFSPSNFSFCVFVCIHLTML